MSQMLIKAGPGPQLPGPRASEKGHLSHGAGTSGNGGSEGALDGSPS